MTDCDILALAVIIQALLICGLTFGLAASLKVNRVLRNDLLGREVWHQRELRKWRGD